MPYRTRRILIMAKAAGVSFSKNKLYLYEYALTQSDKFSTYVVELIEADYNKRARESKTLNLAAISASLTSIQDEILTIQKLIK